MQSIQLEFNIENKNFDDEKLSSMQKQIDLVCDSMSKVRRKLFAELSEVKKLYAELKKENDELKTTLKEMSHEKTKWAYEKNGCLFDVEEYQKAAC